MYRRILTILSCLSVILASALSGLFIVRPNIARAYSSPGRPTGFVNDFAEIIDESAQATMESDLSAFAQTSSNELVVATVKGLDGDSVENYANELFREWGIGSEEKNNGVLLLVSPSDRKVRIEVGYGLEGAITDLETGRIVDGILLPAFRVNDYAGGIAGALVALKTAAEGEYNTPAVARKSSSFINGDSIFYGFFGLIWVSSFLSRSKSWWAGGVIGALVAGLGWLVIDSTAIRTTITIIAPLLGLLLDFLVSKNYQKNIAKGGSGGFFSTMGGFSGGSGRSGGGFGGFSGGSSGGGGSSGSW